MTLPEGYRFIVGDSIDVDEFSALRRSVSWSCDDRSRLDDCLRQSLFVCGVRDADDQLVGIGFVAGNLRHAVFCDLCIHPQHRHRGIAKALFERRLTWTKETGIPYLYASLSDANPLRGLYEAAGFFLCGD